MKYLILMSDGEETFYDLKDINKIRSDYAQNLDQEVDLKEMDVKPLEMLTVIYFNNGSIAAFRTADLEMYYD